MKSLTPARIACALAGSLIAAGCGGGGGTAAPSAIPAAPPTTPRPTGSASIVITIPDRQGSARRRRPSYISASTQSVAITVYPTGTTPPSQPTSVVDLTVGSPSCTQTAPRSCTITLGAPYGDDAFRFALYDQRAGAGNLLSTGTVSATIGPNPAPLRVTLDGVLSSFSLALSQTTAYARVPAQMTLTLNARDADGNLIIAPGNFTTPVSVFTTDDSGTVRLSTGTVHGPGDAAVTVSFNGNAPPGRTFAFRGSATNGPVNTAPDATLTVIGGMAAEYGGLGPHSDLQGIVKASDGNFWFCEQFSSQLPSKIGVMTRQGNVIHQYALPSGGPTHHLELPWTIIEGPATDPAPKMWVVALRALGSVRMSDGAVTEYTLKSGQSMYFPFAVVGPDNAIWFTEGNGDYATIGRLDPALPPNTNPATGPVNPQELPVLAAVNRHPMGIVVGADRNLWFTENGDPGFIARYNLNPPPGVAAGTVTEFATPTANSRPGGLAIDRDGNLWFVETALNKIARMNPIGATPANPHIVEYPNPRAANGSAPRADTISIVAQPDGTLWFAEDPRDGYIGRIDIAGPVVTQYPVPGVDVGMLAADDVGSLWFTETFNTPDRIGHFVY